MEDKVRKARGTAREGLAYLFFGVLTTVVNYGVFFLLHGLLGARWVLLVNLAAFAAATAFAFVTNKRFVFASASWSGPVLLREAASFVAARVFSFGVEEAGLWCAAYPLNLGRFSVMGLDGVMIAKIALSLGATVMNYFFSKFLIFRHSPGEGENGEHT